MEGLGIDYVRIPLSREMIALPWESRQALLEQLAHLDSMRDVRKAFDDVGATWPVRLSQQQKGDLIQVIEHWGSQQPGGLTEGLPSGIFALRNALHDDLHDAGPEG
jgi:hypothetical protein